jgi:hypothetical protein
VSVILKIIAFTILLIAGLLALAMTVCGGGFLISLIVSPSRGDWVLVAIFAIPSLVLGLFFLFGVWTGVKALAGRRD